MHVQTWGLGLDRLQMGLAVRTALHDSQYHQVLLISDIGRTGGKMACPWMIGNGNSIVGRQGGTAVLDYTWLGLILLNARQHQNTKPP
jgi:hypothetical protein